MGRQDVYYPESLNGPLSLQRRIGWKNGFMGYLKLNQSGYYMLSMGIQDADFKYYEVGFSFLLPPSL